MLKLGSSYVVTIPKQVAQMLEIKKGDRLKVSMDGSKIVYEK